MELRVLQYFLAVAREQSISKAADSMYLSQPTLSRQLKELEEELGKQLMIRGNRRVTLTEEGMILRKRAEEIMELVEKAENEISLSDDVAAGDISIGAGETDGVRFLTRTAKAIQKRYPLIRIHIVSGDKSAVLEELDRGLIDFGLIFGEVDKTKYEYVKIPYKDTWGALMRTDSPLAEKDSITAEDLINKPLIMSRQSFQTNAFQDFFHCDVDKLNVVATYNLLFNGSLMVDEGMGYALCLDKIINVSDNGRLCFKPLESKIEDGMNVVWKKYQTHTKAAQKFTQKLEEIVLGQSRK